MRNSEGGEKKAESSTIKDRKQVLWNGSINLITIVQFVLRDCFLFNSRNLNINQEKAGFLCNKLIRLFNNLIC
jgi:hypothetical protein